MKVRDHKVIVQHGFFIDRFHVKINDKCTSFSDRRYGYCLLVS